MLACWTTFRPALEVCPQDDLHEKMFFSLLGLLVGLAEASWWGLPFSQIQNPLAGTFFLFHQLSPFSPSMDNLEPFWVSVLPPYSPKLPWKLSGWPFFKNPTLLVNISGPWWEGDFLSVLHPMPHLIPADEVLCRKWAGLLYGLTTLQS